MGILRQTAGEVTRLIDPDRYYFEDVSVWDKGPHLKLSGVGVDGDVTTTVTFLGVGVQEPLVPPEELDRQKALGTVGDFRLSR